MDGWVWLVLGLILVAAIAAAVIAVMNDRRTKDLRARFGPEYDRAVARSGGRRSGEGELLERERRRERLDIRPLDEDAKRRYGQRWRDVQARFVDEPAIALREADVLVLQVLRERGYPMEDFDRRAGTISVDHPEAVALYRAGHEITEDDEALDDTERLREGLLHYRALFEELLGERSDDTRRKAS